MNEIRNDSLQVLAPENPYASPQTVSGMENDSPAVRIRSVARVFKIVGWFGVVLYTPIVITCIVSLVMAFSGYRSDSPLLLAGASAFNGTILALAISYVLTGRRIAKHDLDARPRAVLLSCLMMIGIPIFTVVGIMCYRYITLYFNDATAPIGETS